MITTTFRFSIVTIALYGIVSLVSLTSHAETPAGVFVPDTMQTLIPDFRFGEGPVQNSDGDIYLCEKDADTIVRIDLNGKVLERIPSPDGCNGLAFDTDGNVFICAQKSKEIIRRTPDGVLTVIADSYQNEPFTFPNDIWLDAKGGFYFTDPNFSEEGPTNTVYYMEPDMRTLHLVNSDMPRPNGIIGSPDGSTLYVTNFFRGAKGETYAFDIGPDGMLSNKRLFAPDGEDGAAVDREGNLYMTGKNLTVYSPEGVKLAELAFPESELLSNCAFVGPDKQTLLVTGWTGVYSVRTTIPGL